MEEDISDETDIISESAEYSPKSDFNKGKLVEDAVRKCIENRATEMKSGYYNIKLTKEGIPIKTWVRDSRNVFIGSVIALKSILTPEINLKEYQEIKNKIKKLEDKEKELFNKYCYTERVKKIKDKKIIWEKTDRNYIPEIDETLVVPNPEITNGSLVYRGAWNNYVNAYWNEMVVLYDEMFSLLNQLINELNYFKQKIGW